VGVSWKTTESSRASGLIAEEFHKNLPSSPGNPSPLVSDLAAKKGAHRNCNKNRRFACAGCQPPQCGEKRTSRRERQKRGAGYKSRANAALARSGGKYPEKFRNMGWMEEPEGIE